jgi:hypothetical protein
MDFLRNIIYFNKDLKILIVIHSNHFMFNELIATRYGFRFAVRLSSPYHVMPGRFVSLSEARSDSSLQLLRKI